MASTHILAVGTISQGSVLMRVAPYADGDRVLAAISFGRRLYEAGASRSACINQDEVAGWDEADAEAFDAMLRQESLYAMSIVQDGALQAPRGFPIDYAAELQELEDDMMDREYWRYGQW
jgi:hypothetical protein